MASYTNIANGVFYCEGSSGSDRETRKENIRVHTGRVRAAAAVRVVELI